MDINSAERYILERLEEELSEQFAYHSLDHTKDVTAQAERIALEEKIGDEDRQLLKVAALYHDAGYIVDEKTHEEESCNIARSVLPGFGFSAIQIESICAMIMATKLPQSPQNKLQEIICDADQDYLGRDDFYEVGQRLYREMKHSNEITDEDAWNKLQVSYLEQHSFFTPSSRKLREPVKQQHLERLRALIS